MTTTPKPRATGPEDKWRNKKIRALLAVGLVAGVGIVGTLAIWNSRILGDVGRDDADAVTPPPASGLIEFFDAGGNWVTGDNGGAAHLLADVALPARTVSANGARTLPPVSVGKIRLAGVDSADQVRLTGQVGITSDRADVEASMSGNLYIAPSCDADAEGARSFVNATSAPTDQRTLLNLPSVTHTVTGPFEIHICFTATLRNEQVESFGPDDSAQVSFDLTAAPATEPTS